MSFLQRKPKAAKAAKSSKSMGGEAGVVSLISSDTGDAYLAFGLQWRSLVESGSDKMSLLLAQRAKATHIVRRDYQIGFGKVKAKVDAAVPIFPAAALAAKAFAKTICFAVRITDDQYWLALIRNGSPTALDEVITGATDAYITDRIRELARQHEQEAIQHKLEPMVVYTDLPQSGFSNQVQYTVHELFDVVRSEEDAFVPVPSTSLVDRFPKGAFVFLGVALLAIAADVANDQYKAYQAELLRKANRVDDLSPEEAWAPALNKFLSETAVPSRAGMDLVRQSVNDLPVLWTGWTLNSTRCQASPVSAQGQRTWSCEASYDRTRIGQTSSKMAATVAARQPKFAVSFPNLSAMTLNWTISHQASPMKLDDFRSPEDLTLKVSSMLQPVMPALAAQPDFKMAPVEIPAPRKKDGTTHPRPSTVPYFYSGPLTLRGPLRSIDLMLQEVSLVDWDSFGMKFELKTSPSQKGMTASSMMVEVTGKVLAMKPAQ